MKPASETAHRVCPLCDADNGGQSPLALSFEQWRLKRCRGCSLVYLENPPGYAALQGEFAWERSFEAEARRRAGNRTVVRRAKAPEASFPPPVERKRRKLPRLTDRYIQKGRIIDVGCGTGKWLASLGYQYELYGIELTPGQARDASRKLESRGARIFQTDALSGLSCFPGDYFSGALMHAYLEHEIHPKRVLQEMWRVLQPGGHVVVKVPNFASLLRRLQGRRWCGLRFPDHVCYFTPSTLRKLLGLCGFDTVRFGLADRLPTSDNMWCVAAKSRIALPFPMESSSVAAAAASRRAA